jgi:hypothetical protein
MLQGVILPGVYVIRALLDQVVKARAEGSIQPRPRQASRPRGHPNGTQTRWGSLENSSLLIAGWEKSSNRHGDAHVGISNPWVRGSPSLHGQPATLSDPALDRFVFSAVALDVTGDDFLAAQPLLIVWLGLLRAHRMTFTLRAGGPKNLSRMLGSGSTLEPRNPVSTRTGFRLGAPPEMPARESMFAA